MTGAAKDLDAFDRQERCAYTANSGTDLLQKATEIRYFRLTRGGFDGGDSIGKSGRQHHVTRAGDRAAERTAQVHAVPPQTVGPGNHVSTFDANVGSKSP